MTSKSTQVISNFPPLESVGSSLRVISKMEVSTLYSSFLFALLLLHSVENSVTQSITRGTVYATENVTDNGQTVILGALFPIHRAGVQRTSPCGEIRSTAVQLVEGMVFAIQTINQDPELLSNISLAFDIRDSCTSVNYALQQSVSFIQSVSNSACNVRGTLATSGVLGAALSSVTEAAANLFGLFEIPQISYASTSPSLSTSQFRYFFRTIPSDVFQAQVLADIMVYFKWSYIMLLNSNDLYGTGGAEAFMSEMKAKYCDACVALQMSLSHNPPNFEEAVDQMAQAWVSNATVVLLFGHSEDSNRLFEVIQQRQRINDSFPLQNITWIGSDSWSTTVPTKYRPLVKGMLGITPTSRVDPEFDKYLSSLNPTNNAQNPWFLELWESRFNCNLGVSTQLPNCSLVNKTLNLSQFSQVSLAMDAVYALAYSIDALINTYCPNRTLCPAITITGGAINGSLLRDQLLNISFESTVLGRVQFNSNGDIRHASYSVFNLQETAGNLIFENVGSWSDDKLTITGNIEWITGTTIPTSICSIPCEINQVSRLVQGLTSCCFTCDSCVGNTISSNGNCKMCKIGTLPSENRTTCELIPLTYLMWSSSWGITIAVLACIGVTATISIIIVFMIFHKHELIRATSRELSCILLFGILLCYIVPFFYIAKPSKAICAIQRFSIGFCFAISYSALLVKTHRIHRIFNRSSSSANKPLRFISPLSQVLFTLGLIGIQVLISVIWLIAERPKTSVVETARVRELQCGSNPYIGFSVFLGYNFILLILSTYYAFRARKVPANFNEAKFINVTLYTICIIWLAFVPIHFSTTGLGVLFRTVTLVLGVIFSAGTTLGCLFVSKVVILFARIKKDKKIETMNKSQMETERRMSHQRAIEDRISYQRAEERSHSPQMAKIGTPS